MTTCAECRRFRCHIWSTNYKKKMGSSFWVKTQYWIWLVGNIELTKWTSHNQSCVLTYIYIYTYTTTINSFLLQTEKLLRGRLFHARQYLMGHTSSIAMAPTENCDILMTFPGAEFISFSFALMQFFVFSQLYILNSMQYLLPYNINVNVHFV